jgi:hypothetical protein
MAARVPGRVEDPPPALAIMVRGRPRERHARGAGSAGAAERGGFRFRRGGDPHARLNPASGAGKAEKLSGIYFRNRLSAGP